MFNIKNINTTKVVIGKGQDISSGTSSRTGVYLQFSYWTARQNVQYKKCKYNKSCNWLLYKFFDKL